MPNERGRGEGYEDAGNTRLTIELSINGQLDRKIEAVNVGMRGEAMVFNVKNESFEFTLPPNLDYIDAFKQLFSRLENARND